MTIHLTKDKLTALCENEADLDDLITLEEALVSEGWHFDCVDCHKKLTGGKSHSEPLS